MGSLCTSLMHFQDFSDHKTKKGNVQEIKGLSIQICEVSPVQSNLTINQIQAETAKDPDMQRLIKCIIEGWPTRQQDCVQQLQSYHTFKEEMSVIDGLVFKGERIVIPASLQQKALPGHSGCFYWSGISKDITHVCETCEECLKNGNKQQK